jgi:hypothetical protein
MVRKDNHAGFGPLRATARTELAADVHRGRSSPSTGQRSVTLPSSDHTILLALPATARLAHQAGRCSITFHMTSSGGAAPVQKMT